MSDPFVAQLGRISGHMLSPDLLRDGINLTFRNKSTDNDLLYLDINEKKIGINLDAPAFDLDVSTILQSSSLFSQIAEISGFKFSENSEMSTINGLSMLVKPLGDNPTVIFNRLTTGSIFFDDNKITSDNNNDIILNPAGTGTVDIHGSAEIRNDLIVEGDIDLIGNLSTSSDITLGDETFSVIIINTDLSQDIEPKDDLTYIIGDVDKRWGSAYIDEWRFIDKIIPFSAVVNNSLLVGGTENSIKSLQPGQDLLILPDTGVYFIGESLRFQNSTILNLNNTPLVLSSTNKGYYKFGGSNAILIPEGTTDERPGQEVGDIRLNTTLGHLEVFDGSNYVISIGEGDAVTDEEMQNLSYLYSLILG
jgi:hypothetical protein